MYDLLITPGAPFFAASLAGALLACLGATTMAGSGRLARLNPSRIGSTAGLVAGQTAGLSLAILLISAALAGGATGNSRNLLFGAALAAYLGLGLVLPRQPQQRREREAAALRRLTPGFVAFVRVALDSFEAPVEIMRRYVRRPDPRLAPMQTLVAEALALGADRRLRPFAALALGARGRGCRELADVAEALAQAEAEGARAETVLAAHQETLALLLQGEFRRLVRRRTLYLLLMVAVSLVVGILFNLLYVMTAGGSLLSSMN